MLNINTKAIIQRDKGIESLFPDKSFYGGGTEDLITYNSWDHTTYVSFHKGSGLVNICVDIQVDEVGMFLSGTSFKGHNFEEAKRKYLLYKNYGVLIKTY